MFKKLKEQILTILIFSISSLILSISIYLLIPIVMKTFQIPFAIAYLGCFYFPFVGLLLTALIIYRKEGHKLTIKEISTRLRLHKLNKKSLKLLVIFFLLVGVGFLVTSLLSRLISDNIKFLAVPESFPAGLNHNKEQVPGYFFGFSMKGVWWYPVLYFIGWGFNIFGEELLFRGILLPKNEKSFGDKAWIFQGTLWGLWHIFWYWQFIPLIIFVALPLVYVVQKSKNTWVGIIIHGILNLIPLIIIISQV
ncbi:MAG: CPBP family intramembrane metalloprotease [Spirochaetales bacterium]|nr:CPBP family intramembrane metalloprotease [Spirochaetales bacterium]